MFFGPNYNEVRVREQRKIFRSNSGEIFLQRFRPAIVLKNIKSILCPADTISFRSRYLGNLIGPIPRNTFTPNGLIVVYNNDAWLRIARANLLLCTPNLRVVRVNSIKGKERRILDLSPMPRRVDGKRKRSEVERLRVLSGSRSRAEYL